MNRQNITLSVDKDILEKAKIITVQKNMSLSELIRKTLKGKINEETEYKNAKIRQLKLLKTGFNFKTNGILILREKIYDRC